MRRADLTMLGRYAGVVEEDLRKSYEEHGPVDRLLRG
jgi:hypothetical protein